MIKILKAEYKEGLSQVILNTDCGTFYGTALLHEEDKDIASSFLGCEIAEYRATIAYFTEKLKRINIEILTLESLRQDFIKRYRENYHECELLEKRLKEKQILKKEYKGNIKSLSELIKNKIENRITILNKIKEKSNKREK